MMKAKNDVLNAERHHTAKDKVTMTERKLQDTERNLLQKKLALKKDLKPRNEMRATSSTHKCQE